MNIYPLYIFLNKKNQIKILKIKNNNNIILKKNCDLFLIKVKNKKVSNMPFIYFLTGIRHSSGGIIWFVTLSKACVS